MQHGLQVDRHVGEALEAMKELERHIAQKKENKAKVGCSLLLWKTLIICIRLRLSSISGIAWTAAVSGALMVPPRCLLDSGLLRFNYVDIKQVKARSVRV